TSSLPSRGTRHPKPRRASQPFFQKPCCVSTCARRDATRNAKLTTFEPIAWTAGLGCSASCHPKGRRATASAKPRKAIRRAQPCDDVTDDLRVRLVGVRYWEYVVRRV